MAKFTKKMGARMKPGLFAVVFFTFNSFAAPILPLVNGSIPVNSNESIYKHVVYIYNERTISNCSGVVFDKDLILTAAHALLIVPLIQFLF